MPPPDPRPRVLAATHTPAEVTPEAGGLMLRTRARSHTAGDDGEDREDPADAFGEAQHDPLSAQWSGEELQHHDAKIDENVLVVIREEEEEKRHQKN